MRLKLEDERRALAAFVSKFDSLGLGMSVPSSKLNPPMPIPGGATAAFAERQLNRANVGVIGSKLSAIDDCSPVKVKGVVSQPSLLEQTPEDAFTEDISFELDVVDDGKGGMGGKIAHKDVFLAEKENIPA
jgi:centromeric protein E